jgi:hypothetical protein
MPINQGAPPYYYIAYIDEAGDGGIRRVRPIDAVGGTEWLVIGAVLIRATREREPIQWVRNVLHSAGLGQRKQLHFRDLDEWRKPLACRELAEQPVRLFALLSNKKNMRGHTNPRAEAKSNPLTPRQYFYNFCLRLILERVTDYCFRRSMRETGQPGHVKIIFSRRGGHTYGHTFAYGELLKVQSRAGTTILQKRTINWQVIDRRLMEQLPHGDNAGLQLADIVASSFYQAVDILPPTKWNTANAKLLIPRVATEGGFYRDYGVALQPTPPRKARLLPQQREIFEFYGYDPAAF